MEYVYNQDCGAYSLEVEAQDPRVDISPYFIIGPTSGIGGPFNHRYEEEITLFCDDSAGTGQYVVDLIVKQKIEYG